MITENRKVEEYYQALIRRDSQYAGIFYVGVKTTNVFCISTCRARKPKKENVAFYESSKEALQYGYRPCKICKPTENVDEVPPEIKHLMALIAERPEQKIRDSELRKMGLRPEKVRRWFQNHYELTFQAYQRMIRINSACENIKKGVGVTQSAFQSGYESLSGFGYTFKNMLKESPENAERVNLIHLHKFSTPLGPMYAGASEKGLCLLEFADRYALETEFQDLTRKLKSEIVTGTNQFTEMAEDQLLQYFEGSRTHFTIPLQTPGTQFQQKVWQNLLDIPYGATRSYKQQAQILGDLKAIRAVASANGQNRIAIVIPCHRVVGSNGSLTGYAGGLPRKKWLLDHEQNQLSLFPS